jgi:uncharacterized membrane protein YidH (DUF202 family)
MHALARLVGALAITAGVTLLTYGGAKIANATEASAAPSHNPEPEAFVAVGAGMLVGGLLAIVLFGARKPTQGD